MMKFSYIEDIFKKFNVINIHFQGANTNSLDLNDKVYAFSRKLALWKAKVEQNNIEMFTNTTQCVKNYKTEKQHVRVLFITTDNYLVMLTENF